MPTLRRFAAAAAALCALAAQAGVKLTTETRRHGKTSTLTMQIEGKNARMEMTKEGSTEPGSGFISDGDNKRLLIVDFGKKEYHELTVEQMKRMKAKMELAMSMMKEQLAKLPPEQRKRMEASMAQMQGAAMPKPPEEKYTRASGSKKIAGYSCDLYTVEVEGKHTADACLIPWGDLKIDREQLRQSLQAMADTWSMGDKPDLPAFKHWGMAAGLPAWRKTVKDEEDEVTETTLTGISQSAVAKSAFEPPAGFTKKTIDEK